MVLAINIIRAADLPAEKISQLMSLKSTIWLTELTPEGLIDEFRLLTKRRNNRTILLVESAGRIISHAEVFERRLSFAKDRITVGCLAGVCVAPAHRNNGIGTKISVEALRIATRANKRVALFQTNIPEFYKRLGCRIVSNEFIDSTREDRNRSPWWQPHVMIFPSKFNWPEDRVEMNGSGF